MEEPVSATKSPLPVRPANSEGGAVDGASTPHPSLAAATPTLQSDAWPPQGSVSPAQQYTPAGGRVYPKPIATQEEVLADRELFMKTFRDLHNTIGSKPSIPKMGKKDLDLHLLYKEVSNRGGVEAVIRDRKWKETTLAFQLPNTTTSASYVLRRYYCNLLFHYEQVYRNGVTGPLLTPPASLSGSSPSVQHGAGAGADSAVSDGGEPAVKKRIRKRKMAQPQLPTVNPAEAIGATVVGSIEGKLDFGYLVTMVVGGEKLKGILYHVPPGHRGPQYATLPGLFNSMGKEGAGSGETQTRRKRRRKDEMPKKDPNAPRPNRTGYNFFFAEQRQRLKLLHPDKEREISRMIGEAWNALSEEEKLPYQERGVEDKERFKKEDRAYKEKLKTGYFDNPANGQDASAGEAVGAAQSPEGHGGAHAEADPLDPVSEAADDVAFGNKQSPSDRSGVSDQLPDDQTPAPALVPVQ